MINLDIEILNDVNLILEKLDAHDRFIEAKIELFEDIDKTKNCYSTTLNNEENISNTQIFSSELDINNKLDEENNMSPFYGNRNIISQMKENNVNTLDSLNPFEDENNMSKEIHNNKEIEENKENKDKNDNKYNDSENKDKNDNKYNDNENKNNDNNKYNDNYNTCYINTPDSINTNKNVKKKKIPEVINNNGKEKKIILTNIINILNYVFPDYEFKYLNNSNYKYIKNINSVIDNINYNLFYIIENIYRGFNKKIWKILKELIDFKYCDVYTYLNDTDNDPYVDKESISSFNYFFFAKKNKRILFISCITKPKYKNQKNDEDFNNLYMGIQDEPSINEQNEYDDEDSSLC
ncbi:repressor of RNA polymerase III transcription MAF1, putative [Plasmodium sp. gorilla clade G3]|nr:repressor of RNA polymerase III transcription MAF1, putative [Plasmodium sp. gorilla clade G3]